MALKTVFGFCKAKAAVCLHEPLGSFALFSNEFRAAASSFSEIPSAPSIPIIGSLPYFLKEGGQTYLHEYADKLHAKLGPIFVTNLLGNKLVFVSDPETAIKVYKTEGAYPEHFSPEHWTLYLQETGKRRGLFFMKGEEWQKNRSVLNKMLLGPKSMINYFDQISSICKNFANVWKTSPPMEKLEYHLYNWNIECMGELAFGKSLGFLDSLKEDGNLPGNLKYAKERQFVQSIHNIFLESANIFAIPAKLAQKLQIPAWKRFHEAITTSLNYGEQYVEENVDCCRGDNVNESRKASLLYQLLHNKEVEEKDIPCLIIDLLMASADTTSHTASWALYLLGRHPSIAEKARNEIKLLLKQNGKLSLNSLNELSYIKGIIRETMRLYPIAAFLTRKLDREANLSGYLVPAESMIISSIYTMGKDLDNYENAASFRPERWFREERNLRKSKDGYQILNRKAYIPWGVGARSCIGRKVAEMELSLLLIEILMAFEWTVEKDVDMILRMVPVPKDKVVLKLRPLE